MINSPATQRPFDSGRPRCSSTGPTYNEADDGISGFWVGLPAWRVSAKMYWSVIRSAMRYIPRFFAMRSRRVAVVAGAFAAATALSPALPADAASAVQIYRVYYNSPGTDNRTNTSLNGEWVRIINKASTKRSLTGWKLKDKTGYTYTFGTFSLAGGKTVYVHTGKGTNTTARRYWGRSAYVWNNTGDTAYLRNSAGTLMDSCSWGSSGSSKYC